MGKYLLNPFNVTKAVDFTDQDIQKYWVDLHSRGGFAHFAKPTSPMPMLILGGKGSGKTHLMRHFSYATQKIRSGLDIVRGIKKDGYVGIYFRCEGLNASRFNGKLQSEEVWCSIFGYFMDLWLAQHTFSIIYNAFSETSELRINESNICKETMNCFDSAGIAQAKNISDMIRLLSEQQRMLTIEVNNCAITHTLNVKIRTAPGSLVFRIPQILVEQMPSLRNVQFLYLVDEFENLLEYQQKYLNTLVREKQIPCSFKIGARLYGIHTYGTYSSEEENKEGSEHESLFLDTQLRNIKGKVYSKFAKRLCARRLSEGEYTFGNEQNLDSIAKHLKLSFPVFPDDLLAKKETAFVIEKYKGKDRPYFKSLRNKLDEGYKAKCAPGVSSKSEINNIISKLAISEYPILEKANTFMLYKEWYSNNSLPQVAEKIADECKKYINSQSKPSSYQQVMSHYRSDLLAQLLRECDQKQRYLGIDTFIDMSCGIPRNLLVILKSIFKWSVFNGEQPFEENSISIDSQQTGVKEAAEWFFQDARSPGDDGRIIRDSISRLARLFREIRFSDKPTECSLSTFSTDISKASIEAQRILDLVEKWSLLIRIRGGQRDRNTKRLDVKYQLNPMLAPRWDLPISRRGTISLKCDEINAIFDQSFCEKIDKVIQIRVDRMTAPFFGKRKCESKKQETKHPTLPGFDG